VIGAASRIEPASQTWSVRVGLSGPPNGNDSFVAQAPVRGANGFVVSERCGGLGLVEPVEQPADVGAVRSWEETWPGAPDFAPQGRCRFVVSPPRNFLYPALLLLLAEEPRHGYLLCDALSHLGLGRMDRPSVYRALGEL
jgi:hypothetical protein